MSVGVGSKYYSGFNPLNLGDCALWLDAADTSTLTLSGSNVTQWNDKSGNGRNTSSVTGTPVLSNNAVNSKTGVYFNGSSYFTGGFSYSSNTLTWIVVGSMESATGNTVRLFSFGSPGTYDYDSALRMNALSREGLTSELVSYRNAYITRNVFVTYGYPFLFSSAIDGTSNSPFFNASAATGAATSGNFGFSQYAVGGAAGIDTGKMVGHIFEIIVYTSVLSTAQRQQIEGYLADKWNLRVNLPGIRYGITPTSISGLQLWLDGTDSTTMTLSGSNVTQWNDKSGNGRNTTAVYGTPQLKTDGSFNGLSAVYFGTGAAFTGPITNNTSNLSVFVVGRLNDVANPRRFLTLGASGRLDYDSASDIAALTTGNSTSELAFYRNYAGSGYQTAIVTPVYNAPFVYSLQIGNGTGTIYRDFTTTASVGNSGVFGYTTYAIAAGFTPTIGAYLGNGYIAEVLVYNALLTENERQDLNNYFATKYARTYTPPAAHIYKSITPVTRQFAPIDIPGCALWLDAADPGSITLSGSNVTQWNDKSGNGYNATAQTGNATYSSNGVVFTGAQMLQTSLSAVIPSQSFFCVASSGSNFSNMGIMSVYSSNLATGYNYTLASNQQLVSRYDGTSIMTGSTFTQGATFLYDATVTSGGSSFLYAYGAQVASNLTTPAISGSNATVSIGAYYYPTADPGPRGNFTGTINEIMLFSNVLTTTQRQQVEGYLARKWGLIGGGIQKITTFSPTNISNCAVWLDAADSNSVTLSGSNVTQWRDKTLNAYVFSQATTSNQPTFGIATINQLPVISFNSSQSLRTTSYNQNSTTATFFVITRVVTATFSTWQFMRFFMGSVIGLPYWYIENNGTFGVYGAVFSVNNKGYMLGNLGTSSLAGPVRMFTASVTGNTSTNFINQNGSALTLTGNATTGGLNTGVTNATIDILGAADGQVGEMILFDRTLTTTEIQQVEGYLASKWGLNTSLPSSHPYALVGLPSTHPFISRLPATTVFNPRQISNCSIWLDGADLNSMTFSGSNITVWNDKSGNAYNFTASGTGATYGSNPRGVLFAGNLYTSSYTAAVTNETIAMVCQYYNTISGYMIGSSAAGGRQVGVYSATQFGTVNSLVIWGATTSSNTVTSNTNYLVTSIFSNGTNTQIAINGSTSFNSSNITAFSAGTTQLGREGTSAYPFQGTISEIVAYSRVLSTSERQQLEAYLAWKWGLNGGYSPSLTPFTPTSVTGCALWLDAADSNSIDLSGTSVTTWRDKSGNGRNASGGVSPTYASNGIVFNGSTQYLTTTLAANNSPATYFIIFQTSSDVTTAQALFGATVLNALVVYFNVGLLRVGDWNILVAQSSDGITGLTRYLATITSTSGTTLGIGQNGGSITTGTGTLSGTGTFTIGAGYTDNRFKLNGTIYEIIAYTNSLSVTDRQNVEGYLANKWGLTSTLPFNHPYANRTLPSTHPYKKISPI